MNINVLIYRLKKHIGLNGILKNVYSDYKIRDSIMSSLIEFNRHSGFAIAYTLRDLQQKTNRNNNDDEYDVGGYKDVILSVPDELLEAVNKAGCRIKSVRSYEIQKLFKFIKETNSGTTICI